MSNRVGENQEKGVLSLIVHAIIIIDILYFGLILDITLIKWFIYIVYSFGAIGMFILVTLYTIGYQSGRILKSYLGYTNYTSRIYLSMVTSLIMLSLIAYSGHMILFSMSLCITLVSYYFINEAIKYKKWENRKDNK
jgi:hypothetical protein